MMTAAHDFDFIYGSWTVHNRKLVDMTDPDCDEWAEFDGVSEAAPILDGYGHVDRYFVERPTDGGAPFEGYTLRLYEPAEAVWRIWWSSTRAPGVLDVPVKGRFTGRHGVFDAADTVAGRPVVVRYEWLAENPEEPRWQQSFSFDGGESWCVNWTMRLTRRAATM